MRVILCIDDRGGMMFNHRRQSRDREVIKNILDTVGENTLRMAPYSRSLFAETPAVLLAEDSFLDLAGKKDWCFVEDRALLPYAGEIEEMILYRWNRTYPFDVKLDLDPIAHGFLLCESVEFAGYSHETITKEIYRK